MLIPMPRPKPKFSDQIRQEISHCGFSQYRISKETGIDPATLSRFMRGERGLPMKTLDRLADFLDLSVVSSRTKMRKGK